MQHEKNMEGKIVEYIEGGKFVCALCIGKKANKLHILNVNNRETNISPKRIALVSEKGFDLSKPREALLRYIKESEAERERLKDEVNVKELWGLIKDEDEVFQTRYLAQLIFGEDVTEAHVSALMRALFEDKQYFRYKNGIFYPNTEEEVLQIIKKREEDALKKERIDKGSRWIEQIIRGQDVQAPDFADYIIDVLKNMFIFGKDAPDYEVGSEILSKVGMSDPSMIKDILIRMGEWDEDENISLIKRGIPTSFSSRVMAEVFKLREKDLNAKGREDLRDLYVFTIDGEETKDFDDALSIEFKGEEIHVGIHISDVSEWIEPDGVIDLEAKRRGSSWYLPRRQIPMLPPELSHELLSLKEGEDRLSISLLMQMDLQGNILRYTFVPGLIRVKQQLTYGTVDKNLERDEGLSQLYRLANILRQKRIRNGGLDISLPEVKIGFKEDDPSDISIKLVSQDTPAHIIVAEFMILYNWLAARFCMENKIPILYRTQERPVEIVPAQEGINKLYYIFQQMKRFGPMLISTQPAPHHTLGVDVYTHTTSPLRRYLDLLVQRQIKSFLFKKEMIYDTKRLEEIRREVEPAVREIQAMTRERIRYWCLKYLCQHMEKRYKAVVLNELKKRYRIVICDLVLVAEIRRRPGIILSPGSEIWVRVKKVDPWRDILELRYDEDKTS